MKIGFLNNQIDNRGTGLATFDYAHYNEAILGNKSKIFTLPNANHNEEAVDRYVRRFGDIHIPSSDALYDCDALYHIKSGENDNFVVDRGIPYLVHAVFHPQPHGDRFAVISEWMGLRDKLPFVPHIVQLPQVYSNLRPFLKIPDDGTVFGRHGGFDSFDIPWAWKAIEYALKQREDIYFIFVNTPAVLTHERVFYFPPTVDRHALRVFINTCDAMIHARNRGETFGIAVGEFAHFGKPVITYGDSYEKAHIFELRGTALTYQSQQDLEDRILDFNHGTVNHKFYDKFTPENVMAKFKAVFLDGYDTRNRNGIAP
jgi:hypothetical protein